jgi:hypothetical protein
MFADHHVCRSAGVLIRKHPIDVAVFDQPSLPARLVKVNASIANQNLVQFKVMANR